jgi:hypothetical protein
MDVVEHIRNRSTVKRLGAICAAASALCIPHAAQGMVEVNVTRAGFPTLQRGDVIRSGAWVPIIVDLALLDEQSFDGSVRLGQFDNDGDECYDRVDVHLRAETGGAQRLYLYALANPLANQGRFIVELFDDEGEAVEVVSQGELTFQAQPAQRPSTIDPDDILILLLSSGTLGDIQKLTDPDQQERFAPPVHIGHISPTELPELWIGLETVDYIVWDDARPEQLRKRQIDALLEWVRQGGTLLITASRTAGSLRLTDSIYAVLPVDLGEIKAVENLPDLRRALLAPKSDRKRRSEIDSPWWEIPFESPVTIVECALRDGAVRVPEDGSSQSDIVTRRRIGRGHVIFCAVTLRDLLGGGGDARRFFRELFHLRVLADPDAGSPGFQSLFSQVVGAVAFTRSGSLYLGVAIIFSAGYVLLATFGTWGVLGARGWRHHSWTAFALVGVAASLLSVVAVNSVRGFGETLHQLTIVDLDAGQAHGYATAFFGLKTGTDRTLDLWLPSDPLGATEPGATRCFLRPLPVGNDPATASTSYADPGEYRVVPASAVIDGVRIRATLKRFEGRWAGSLGGTVTGEIAVKGIRILEGSYVINDLGVDLKECYLLHTTRALTGDTGPRSGEIYAFPIGDVPSDGRKLDLVARCYPVSGNPRSVGDEETVTQIIDQSTLASAQKGWGSPFAGFSSKLGYGSGPDRPFTLGEEKNALLLLSTAGECEPQGSAGMAQFVFGSYIWSRDRLRGLDLREDLRPDTVILIGFADDPGPVRLFRRTGDRPYRMLEPDRKRSWTMYRIRIPATLHDVPSEPEDEDGVR